MRRTPHARENGPAMAVAIEAARTRLGLSQGDLAARLGVSRLTIRELELGRDSRASTLVKVLGVLDDVLPPDLLGHAGRPPASVDAAWAFDRRLHGASARTVLRELSVAEDATVTSRLVVVGVRLRREDLASAAHLADLLRLVVQGGSGVLAQMRPVAEALLHGTAPSPIDEGGTVHAISLRPGATPEIHYERQDAPRRIEAARTDVTTATDCLAIGSVAVAQLPVERLTVDIVLPPQARCREPIVLAWLGALVPEAGEAGLARTLRAPHATTKTVGVSRYSLVVERPLTGTVVGLGWRSVVHRGAPSSRAGSARPRRSDTRAVPLAATLRSAREAAGVSMRELAERMGVGPMTVSDAERGRDVRASTLRAMLAALPDVTAWDLLVPESFSPTQAWAFRRDLFGCAVDVETKLVEITPEGDASMHVETKNLRLLAPRPGPLRVRMGFSVPTVVRSRASLRAVAVPKGRAGVVRITAVTGTQAERLHQLSVPEKLAREGVTYTRELLHRAVYALTAERARERMGTDGPFHEGASFASVLPVQRLRLVVRFPPRTWPADITSHAWPMSQAPDPAAAGLGSWLHPEGLGLEASERRREISLTVEHPIIGAKYGIGWRLR